MCITWLYLIIKNIHPLKTLNLQLEEIKVQLKIVFSLLFGKFNYHCINVKRMFSIFELQAFIIVDKS